MDGTPRRGRAEGHPAPRSRPGSRPSSAARPSGLRPPEPPVQRVLSPRPPAHPLHSPCFRLIFSLRLGMGSLTDRDVPTPGLPSPSAPRSPHGGMEAAPNAGREVEWGPGEAWPAPTLLSGLPVRQQVLKRSTFLPDPVPSLPVLALEARLEFHDLRLLGGGEPAFRR